MKNKSNFLNILYWIFGLLFFIIGLLNIFLIHVVPGVIYILISLVYFPPLSNYVKEKFRFSIPIIVKIVLAFIVIWFTLGISDLMELFEQSMR